MDATATMRALRQIGLGGPADLMFVDDAPVPVPQPGEVLIRVTAAGVNFVDISQSRGTFAGGPRPPYVAGIEAAGEVVAIADDVTGLALGMRVLGVSIEGGAFADYAALPAAAVIPISDGWGDVRAPGLLVSAPTALAALRPLGRLAEGETVLIHAAAGGTGQLAVRMAKHFGATVIAAASPDKHETVRALGADHVIDARAPHLAEAVMRLTDGAGVDLALESVGGATFEESLAATKRVTGRVVVFGLVAGEASLTNWDLVYRHQVQVIGLNIGALIRYAPQVFGAVMEELFALIAHGVLPPVDPTTYALTDGPRALADLEARATTGRIVLVP